MESMKLRDNFPNNNEEAKVFDVEIRDELAVFKIFETKETIEDTVRNVNIFLEKNGYEQIDVSKFVENEYSYYSEDEIVSLSLHGYIEALVLFINKELGTIVVEIGKKVLARLTEMDSERKGGNSGQRLIFPNTFPSEIKSKDISEEKLLQYTRISEQELRFLFVEEFINNPHNGFFYSVETPTEEKYKFGKKKEDVPSVDIDGQSASLDMCIFKSEEYENKNEYKYKRILNIEFKYDNVSTKTFSKDILKLMYERQNGAFVLLLKNTDAGTLKSVFNKFSSSFETHEKQWKGEKDKFIQLIILSLEEKKGEKGIPFLVHRKINQNANLLEVFSFNGRLSNIDEVKRNGWEIEPIEKVRVGDLRKN
jgi:hypothetical protein